MQPVSVSTEVPQDIERVYAFLDVMGNHEQFTDHMLRDWQLSGPERGVGSRANVTAVMGNRAEPVAIEVVESEEPRTIVERNVGAAGKRVAHGTYRLAPSAAGGTAINFEYAWKSAPLSERLGAPVVRAIVRRGLQRSMERLRDALA